MSNRRLFLHKISISLIVILCHFSIPPSVPWLCSGTTETITILIERTEINTHRNKSSCICYKAWVLFHPLFKIFPPGGVVPSKAGAIFEVDDWDPALCVCRDLTGALAEAWCTSRPRAHLADTTPTWRYLEIDGHSVLHLEYFYYRSNIIDRASWIFVLLSCDNIPALHHCAPLSATTHYLIRNRRDFAPVHEEQVHALYVLPPSPSLLDHGLAVQYSVQPHLTSKSWRYCKRTSLLAVNYCVKHVNFKWKQNWRSFCYITTRFVHL